MRVAGRAWFRAGQQRAARATFAAPRGGTSAGVDRSVVVLGFFDSAEHINLTAGNVQSENPGEVGILFA